MGDSVHMSGSCAGVLTGVRCWTSRSEAETGVLREMDRRSSWLSAWGREPYMEGEKKLAEMLGLPMPSHRLLSSCKAQPLHHQGARESIPPVRLHALPQSPEREPGWVCQL